MKDVLYELKLRIYSLFANIQMSKEFDWANQIIDEFEKYTLIIPKPEFLNNEDLIYREGNSKMVISPDARYYDLELMMWLYVSYQTNPPLIVEEYKIIGTLTSFR